MNLEEIRKQAFEEAKKGLREEFAKKDALIIQAVSSLDEVEKTVNTLAERLREWYSLHFPEADKYLKDHEKYTKMVSNGDRSKVDGKTLKLMADKSVGAELTKADYKILETFSNEILSLYKTRDNLDTYISSMMKKIAPNIESLAGPSVGARLIRLAGSLENMAKMPASTIQVLGAEKALFRHLKTNAKGPKYGIIFQCPIIHASPKKHRGKIARTLGSKLAIAAKVDFYDGKLVKSLKEKFDKKVKGLQK